MIGRAMSIGIAKPMPLLLDAIAVLIPITFPPASSSGPPELPGLMAASVWMRLVSDSLLSVVIARPLADTMPLVTELEYVPSGLPIATTSWPTLSASDSPMAADGRPVASTLTMARSVSVSMPYTLPDRTRPSLSSTSNFSPPSTTWWLVRIQPLLSKMTPDPTPVGGMTPKLPVSDRPVMVMRTTAGLTADATAIVADDSSMATGWTAPALVAWDEVDTGAGRSRAPAASSARTVPP